MTDIAIRDDATTAPAVTTQATARPPSTLAAWANDARQASQLAESLATTAFVPQTLRGNTPELTVSNVTAAILAGLEMGLPPMAALRSMDIIYGTPALRAHAMRGLVQSHGHSVQLVEATPDRCEIRGRRRGEADWQTVVWTFDRASKMGLTGKGEWKKQQQTMLIARATGEICRLIAADVLFAMPYAAEEIGAAPSWDRAPAAPASRVTFEEIVGAEPPVIPDAPSPEAEPSVDAIDEESLVADDWFQAWSEIGTAAQERGWSKEYTEQQFADLNDGLQVGAADVSDLQAFLAFMTGGAA